MSCLCHRYSACNRIHDSSLVSEGALSSSRVLIAMQQHSVNSNSKC